MATLRDNYEALIDAIKNLISKKANIDYVDNNLKLMSQQIRTSVNNSISTLSNRVSDIYEDKEQIKEDLAPLKEFRTYSNPYAKNWVDILAILKACSVNYPEAINNYFKLGDVFDLNEYQKVKIVDIDSEHAQLAFMPCEVTNYTYEYNELWPWPSSGGAMTNRYDNSLLHWELNNFTYSDNTPKPYDDLTPNDLTYYNNWKMLSVNVLGGNTFLVPYLVTKNIVTRRPLDYFASYKIIDVGNYVLKDGDWYKCIADPYYYGEWDSSKFVSASYLHYFSSSDSYSAGEKVIYQDYVWDVKNNHSGDWDFNDFELDQSQLIQTSGKVWLPSCSQLNGEAALNGTYPEGQPFQYFLTDQDGQQLQNLTEKNSKRVLLRTSSNKTTSNFSGDLAGLMLRTPYRKYNTQGSLLTCTNSAGKIDYMQQNSHITSISPIFYLSGYTQQ